MFDLRGPCLRIALVCAVLLLLFCAGAAGSAAAAALVQPQANYVVALDAGHGGMDSGAQAFVEEVVVCETTVDALCALLDADGRYMPVRTRRNGEDLSTDDRALAARRARADLLLSIHANCDSSGQSHGFECYPTPPGRVYSAASLRLAQCIAARMDVAGHRLRGESGIHYAYYNGKSKTIVDAADARVRTLQSFGMVEKPPCPAVLVEQCFISNWEDTQNWATAEGCERAAAVYYLAICDYFGIAPQA